MESESKWSFLFLNDSIVKTYQLVGIEYSNEVLLFGGTFDASYNAYILNSEGEQKEDLS